MLFARLATQRTPQFRSYSSKLTFNEDAQAARPIKMRCPDAYIGLFLCLRSQLHDDVQRRELLLYLLYFCHTALADCYSNICARDVLQLAPLLATRN